MTRDEAIMKINSALIKKEPEAAFYVTMLEALGLLHLKTTEDKVRMAAVERLGMAIIEVEYTRGADPTNCRITRNGALEILDVLTKSGFRITRE